MSVEIDTGLRSPRFAAPLPLSLYVHIPWCMKKCPYCDFNSLSVAATCPRRNMSMR